MSTLFKSLLYVQVLCEDGEKVSSDEIRRMNEEEFEDLLNRHRADEDALLRLRNAEADRLTAKLKERLSKG